MSYMEQSDAFSLLHIYPAGASGTHLVLKDENVWRVKRQICHYNYAVGHDCYKGRLQSVGSPTIPHPES